MPFINMMCDRCYDDEHAVWDQKLGCYLCAKCRAAEHPTKSSIMAAMAKELGLEVVDLPLADVAPDSLIFK